MYSFYRILIVEKKIRLYITKGFGVNLTFWKILNCMINPGYYNLQQIISSIFLFLYV